MNNLQNWTNILTHLFILCGIRKMSDAEHAAYVADMFTELKNKFTDETIGVAARKIAENENLYGNYPPLAIWLKYCPMKRELVLEENRLTGKFMDMIDCICQEDGMWFNAESAESYMREKFGERGIIALLEFGGVPGVRASGYKQASHVVADLKKQIRKAWKETKDNESVLKIASGSQLAITSDK